MGWPVQKEMSFSITVANALTLTPCDCSWHILFVRKAVSMLYVTENVSPPYCHQFLGKTHRMTESINLCMY